MRALKYYKKPYEEYLPQQFVMEVDRAFEKALKYQLKLKDPEWAHWLSAFNQALKLKIRQTASLKISTRLRYTYQYAALHTQRLRDIETGGTHAELLKEQARQVKIQALSKSTNHVRGIRYKPSGAPPTGRLDL